MTTVRFQDAERLERAALECGAFKACVLPVSAIVLNAEFRGICETNQCGAYGRYWVCPPACGDIETLMARVRACDFALFYQTVGALEDSFDVEGMQRAKIEYSRVGQRLLRAFPCAGRPGRSDLPFCRRACAGGLCAPASDPGMPALRKRVRAAGG